MMALFLLCFLLHLSQESLAGDRPKAFRPFAGLSFLDLQDNDWLGNGPSAQARRMSSEIVGSNRSLLKWERRVQRGSHVGSDGAEVHFSAEGRPHYRYTHIFSADLELGISHIFCQQLGGRNIAILAQGSSYALRSLKEAVHVADSQDGMVLLVGSEGWGCDPGYHWYAELDRVSSEMRGAVQFSAKLLEFQEVFEDLEISFSLRPPSSNYSSSRGRRLEDSMFKETTAGTEYGFNWDWENQKPVMSPLSLLGAEANIGSTVSAGINIECVECFARAVGSLDVKYSYNLFQPRIYVSLSGNAEVHGWVEVTAQAHAYAQEWNRMIANFELPTIHFSYMGLPVSITPFTQLRSLTSLSSGRMLGSMRGGFGARGHVVGTFHMNTRDWDQLPSRVHGVDGVDANLDINFGTKLVTPSFAFEAENTDFTFRLIPSVGVRLWRSLAVEMRAEAYMGTQIIRKNGDYRFEAGIDDTSEGSLRIRPEEIGYLMRHGNLDKNYQMVVKVNGEASEYKAGEKCTEFVSFRDDGDNGVEMYYDFDGSKLGANEHLNFSSAVRRSLVETGKFSLEVEMSVTHEGRTTKYTGKLQSNRRSECEEVARSDYVMIQCDFVINLENSENSRSKLGDLKLVVYWVPKNAAFLPTGVEGLYFVHPPRPEANLEPATWACGEKYFLAWMLNPEEVMRKENKREPDFWESILKTLPGQRERKYYDNSQADPCFTLSLATEAGDPLEIKGGVQEIKKCDLSYPYWSFDWMYMPKRAAGHRVKITAAWNNMENEPQSKTVEVNVKNPDEVDFVLTHPPEDRFTMQAWEDMIVTWRVKPSVDGRVTIHVRDGNTWELMHKKKDIDATKGEIRIAWLHLRAEAAVNRAVILLVTFKSATNERPVTILRHLDVGLPPPMHRRLSNPLDEIRDNMFKHCEPVGQYSMYGGIDVSGHIWRMGSCEDKKVYCPEGEIVGGNHRIVHPNALGCRDARGGFGWCAGFLHSCSHGKTKVIDRPVFSLQMSKRMETIPAFHQIEELKTRIALALSLMPEDISLTNVSAMMEKAPELLFKVIGQSDLQISEALVQYVVDSGQLSFQDGDLLAPSAALAGGRRMQATPRMLSCDSSAPYSPLGVTLIADDVTKPLCARSPLKMAAKTDEIVDTDGFEILGVAIKPPSRSQPEPAIVDRLADAEKRLSSLESTTSLLTWMVVLQCIGLIVVGGAYVAYSKGCLSQKRSADGPLVQHGTEMAESVRQQHGMDMASAASERSARQSRAAMSYTGTERSRYGTHWSVSGPPMPEHS